MRFATLALLLVCASAPAVLAQPVFVTHTTPTISFKAYNTGYYGATDALLANPAATGFPFNGEVALYEGQLLVAFSNSRIAGQPYSDSPTGPTPGVREWSAGPLPAVITPPAPFDQAFETSFTDQSTLLPLGVSVVQRTYTSSTVGLEDFLIVGVDVTNASSFAEPVVHIGMFADFDVDAGAIGDRGSFDATTQTVYTFKNTAGGNRNYYGVTLLDGMMASGWNVSTTTTSDAGLYAALTVQGTTPTANGDRRNVIGAGPFSLAVGAMQRVRFAYVAGTNLADLLANAATARGLFPVAGETGPTATAAALSAPFPNPASHTAQVSLTVEQTQAVRVTLVDALGREVAVLHDGAVAAGLTLPMQVAARSLPAGVYVVRAQGETFSESRQVVVAR